MPFVINVVNVKSGEITHNGNVNFGPTIQNSHTANNKYIGFLDSAGDFSPAFANMINTNVDPDVSDQDQIANPSAPIMNQV